MGLACTGSQMGAWHQSFLTGSPTQWCVAQARQHVHKYHMQKLITCQPQQLCACVHACVALLQPNTTQPLTVLLAWLRCTIDHTNGLPIKIDSPDDNLNSEWMSAVCLLQANRCKWHGLVQHCRRSPGVNLQLERTGMYTLHWQTYRHARAASGYEVKPTDAEGLWSTL
jgi:hypothetical protein